MLYHHNISQKNNITQICPKGLDQICKNTWLGRSEMPHANILRITKKSVNIKLKLIFAFKFMKHLKEVPFFYSYLYADRLASTLL